MFEIVGHETYHANPRLRELNLHMPSTPTDFYGVNIPSVNNHVSDRYNPPENLKRTYLDDGLRGNYAKHFHNFCEPFRKLSRGEYKIRERIGNYIVQHPKTTIAATGAASFLTLLAIYAGGNIHNISNIGETVYALFPNPGLQPFTYLYAAVTGGGKIIGGSVAGPLEQLSKITGAIHILWHLPSQLAIWLGGCKLWEKYKGGDKKS